MSTRDCGRDICAKSGSGSGSACSSAIGFSRRLGGTALEVGGGDARIVQGDYNLALAAVSYAGAGGVLDTALYVGTVDVYKCTLAVGCSLRNTTNAVNGCTVRAMVAPAQHAIAGLSSAGAGPLIYLGNDGGVWRSLDGINELASACSTDDATHFDNLNGGIGSLAEVVSFAQHPTDAGQLLAGLGANGTAGTGAAFSAAPALAVWGQFERGRGWGGGDRCGESAALVCIDRCGCECEGLREWDGMYGGGFCGSGDDRDSAGEWGCGAGGCGVDAGPRWFRRGMMLGTCRVWRGPVAGGSLWSSANAISRMFGAGSGSTGAPACGASGSYVRSLGAGGALSNSGFGTKRRSHGVVCGAGGELDGGGTLGGHVFTTAAGGTATTTTA